MVRQQATAADQEARRYPTAARVIKPFVRYQLTVLAGENPLTGKRQQVRRRYTTEKQARGTRLYLRSGQPGGHRPIRAAQGGHC